MVSTLRLGFAIGLSILATVLTSASAAEVVTIAGTGRDEFSGDGGTALAAGLGQPFGLEIGPDGALYFCEYSNHVIRRLDLKSKIISTVAGTGRQSGYRGDGAAATAAALNLPHEIRFDDQGNYFVADMANHVIRRIDGKSGIITTVAGIGKAGFSGDGGPAIQAQLDQPHSVVVSPTHGLLICDIRNQRVRQVDLKTGIISTFAGTGEKKPTPDGSPIAGTPLNGPRTLALQPNGDLILVLREGNAVYRVNLQTKLLEHLAGTGKQGFAGDGGPPRVAQFAGPKGVAVDKHGNILLVDTENHCIRVIRKDGRVETLVGDGKVGDGPDGPAQTCRLNRPHGVFIDAEGAVYIGDSSNHKIRKLSAGW